MAASRDPFRFVIWKLFLPFVAASRLNSQALAIACTSARVRGSTGFGWKRGGCTWFIGASMANSTAAQVKSEERVKQTLCRVLPEERLSVAAKSERRALGANPSQAATDALPGYLLEGSIARPRDPISTTLFVVGKRAGAEALSGLGVQEPADGARIRRT